jgi:hypothetical protein
MATDYRIVWAAGLALLGVGVLGCDRATALEFKDIAGKWCTNGGTEQFDHDTLTAVPAGAKEKHVYRVERYDFHAKKVTILWRDEAKGESYQTDFANFSADHSRMIQLKTKAGPRRAFHRC